MDKMFHLRSSVPKGNTKNYSLGEDGYETGGRGHEKQNTISCTCIAIVLLFLVTFAAPYYVRTCTNLPLTK